MKLRYEGDLAHQRAAIDAVLEEVERCGSPIPAPVSGAPVQGNPIALPTALTVEMETGTGKTYVFIRTALELAQTHGVRKFVVVVPSVAIREGVLKTLQLTREHFASLYPSTPFRFFAYRRERLARLRRFVAATTVEFVVLTVDAFTKDSNVLRRPCDAFGGATPLQALAACRPVVISDEAHHLQTSLRVAAIESLAPAMVLHYGATLAGVPGPVVHRLSAAESHRRGLVKTIIVHGCPQAEQTARFSAQIRGTIAAHLARQASLDERGIKVLSLFFVDRVAGFTSEHGLIRELFDQHFDTLKVDHPRFRGLPAAAVRAGYFAARRGRAVDSKTGRSAADADAYDLILRDKERLLSFEEPVSFVFSHSALREGWDNPNVFQICTLAQSSSVLKKRQEIGRGVRLCVDQQGRRVRDPDVNQLEVFANESYEAYVESLQREVEGLDPQLRPPPPQRRGGETSSGPTDAATDWFDAAAGLERAQLVEAAGQALRGFEAGPVGGGVRSVLDEASAALRRHVPPAPLSRRLLLDVLEASGRGPALLSDPVRGGRALAHAVLQALQSVGA